MRMSDCNSAVCFSKLACVLEVLACRVDLDLPARLAVSVHPDRPSAPRSTRPTSCTSSMWRGHGKRSTRAARLASRSGRHHSSRCGWSFGGYQRSMPPIILRWCDSPPGRSEEHTSELKSLMRISYAVFCLTKKKPNHLHCINHAINRLSI